LFETLRLLDTPAILHIITRAGLRINRNWTTSTTQIEYITIASTGNGASFGLLSQASSGQGGASNSIRGIIAGGQVGANPIASSDYVTIATLGNSLSFGNITAPRFLVAGLASPSRAVFSGGITTGTVFLSTIDYVMI
jgi:hypothetical protein